MPNFFVAGAVNFKKTEICLARAPDFAAAAKAFWCYCLGSRLALPSRENWQSGGVEQLNIILLLMTGD